MSGESPNKTGRGYARNLDAGQLQSMIDSWDLHLRAERKSAKIVRTYLEAAQWFAAGYLLPAGLADWDEVKARHVQEWVMTLLGRYSDCYANNQFRALQQFFKWHATEDPDEPRPNPMVGLKPPKIGDKLVPAYFLPTKLLESRPWINSLEYSHVHSAMLPSEFTLPGATSGHYVRAHTLFENLDFGCVSVAALDPDWPSRMGLLQRIRRQPLHC